jgi:hypothetical protein
MFCRIYSDGIMSLDAESILDKVDTHTYIPASTKINYKAYEVLAKEAWICNTRGLFSTFDWSRSVVAGGSVLRSIVETTDNDLVWENGDVDVFVRGEVESYVLWIRDSIKKLGYSPPQVSKNGCVTTVTTWWITVQFISVEEQLLYHQHNSSLLEYLEASFDLDICALYLVSGEFFKGKRGNAALLTKMNVISTVKCVRTVYDEYEVDSDDDCSTCTKNQRAEIYKNEKTMKTFMRAMKYSARGFGFFIPCCDFRVVTIRFEAGVIDASREKHSK